MGTGGMGRGGMKDLSRYSFEIQGCSENSKFEYRNPKQIQMTKIQMFKTNINNSDEFVFDVLNFEHLDFVIVSYFGFRI